MFYDTIRSIFITLSNLNVTFINFFSGTKTGANICLISLYKVTIATITRMISSTPAKIGLVQVIKAGSEDVLSRDATGTNSNKMVKSMLSQVMHTSWRDNTRDCYMSINCS